MSADSAALARICAVGVDRITFDPRDQNALLTRSAKSPDSIQGE